MAPTPTAGPKTFISYARGDSEFALKLAADLRAARTNIWLDRFDIPVGMNWPRAVQEALDSCGQFLLILSPASVESPDVMAEVDYALAEGKRIFPVLHQNCKVPFRIRSAQYADFTGDYKQGFSDLLKALVVHSAETADGPTQRAREPLSSAPLQPSPLPWWQTHFRTIAILVVPVVLLSGWWIIVQPSREPPAVSKTSSAAGPKGDVYKPAETSKSQPRELRDAVVPLLAACDAQPPRNNDLSLGVLLGSNSGSVDVRLLEELTKLVSRGVEVTNQGEVRLAAVAAADFQLGPMLMDNARRCRIYTSREGLLLDRQIDAVLVVGFSNMDRIAPEVVHAAEAGKDVYVLANEKGWDSDQRAQDAVSAVRKHNRVVWAGDMSGVDLRGFFQALRSRLGVGRIRVQ